MSDQGINLSKVGWTAAVFGEVVRQVKDKVDPEDSGLERYVAGEHMDTDDLRIRRWGEIGDGYLGPAFHMRFKPGHVLYGSRRTYLRKVSVARFEGITANTTYVLESADPEVLLPELLPFIMQTEAFAQHSVRESKGSVNPYVNFSDLAWFDFTLPPLEEQRRMAALLCSAESYIEALRDLRNSLHDVELGLLDDVIPNAREETLLPVAALLCDGPRNGISPNVNSDGKGLKTVSISAVNDGLFEPSGCVKYALIDRDAAQPFFVRSGDVFLVRGNGNRLLCGTAGLSRRSYDELFYPDLLIRLRFDETKILPEFAVAQWNMPRVHAQLLSRAKSSNGIWKINGQDVRAHKLFVPPIEAQRTIVERLSELRRNAGAARARQEDARRLKAQMLKLWWGSDE